MTTTNKAGQRRYRLDLTWPVLFLTVASAVPAWQTPGSAQEWNAGGARGDAGRVVGPGSNAGANPGRFTSPGDTPPPVADAPTMPVISLGGRQLYQWMFHAAAWVRAKDPAKQAKDPAKQEWRAGSAWLVDRSERLLVTNHHVISWGRIYVLPDRFLQVYFPESRDGSVITDPDMLVREGRGHQVRVIDDDPLRDLALLRVEELPGDREPLPLARESCQPGETVHSIGNPGGQVLWVYSSGTVRQIFRNELKVGGFPVFRYRCVETQSPVNPGDSGGPVVNVDGGVVAVNSGRLLAMSPSVPDPQTTYTVDVSEVRAFLDGARPLLHPETAEDYNRRGLHYLSRARIDPALADFDEALKRLPPGGDPAAILLNRGRAHCALVLRDTWSFPRFDKAVDDLTAALKSRPGDPEILVARGDAYLKAKNEASARADFEAAIASVGAGKTPANPEVLARAHFGRYQLLWAKTDREGCVACLTEAIRLDPKNPLYPLCRGARLGELGKNELALEDADKALEITGKDLDPGDWIEFAPYVYVAFHNRACAHAALKRRDDALKNYASALAWAAALPPSKPLARFVVKIGQELYHQGFVTQATQTFEYAEKMSPGLAAERPTQHQRHFLFRNKSPERVLLYVKYHIQVDPQRWEWRPGDLSTTQWLTMKFEPGEAKLVSVEDKPVMADRVRFVVVNERNETLHKKYWSQDLVLVPPQGYPSFVVTWLPFTFEP
jgi:tetratricopeptide (TPR) repeat protein/S1-C subfamily serine protease